MLQPQVARAGRSALAWQQVTVRLSREDYPRAEALLELAGATSIAVTDNSQTPIFEPEPGTVPLWDEVTLRVLFDADLNLDAIGSMLQPTGHGDVIIERLDEVALAAGMAEPIRPQRIGPRLTIVPAEDLSGDDKSALGLHMGLAFGTGQHPTTQLCLKWLESELPDGAEVLDYGAGSGVLALAALKLGASRATAVDIEPLALEATRRNAELNDLGMALRIGPPELAEDGKFSVILANILARPLMELRDSFAARQADGDRIALSGVLVSQLDELKTHYSSHYEQFDQRVQSGWGLLTAVRRNGYDR